MKRRWEYAFLGALADPLYGPCKSKLMKTWMALFVFLKKGYAEK